jgi:hypothetical protein
MWETTNSRYFFILSETWNSFEFTMSIDKTIRRVTDSREQQRQTDRYWQSQPVGDRLSAVWDLSEAAYAFAAAFKRAPRHDDRLRGGCSLGLRSDARGSLRREQGPSGS